MRRSFNDEPVRRFRKSKKLAREVEPAPPWRFAYSTRLRIWVTITSAMITTVKIASSTTATRSH